MADNGVQKWDYTLVDVWFVEWYWVNNPKKRAELRLDPDVDWEGLATRSRGWQKPSGRVWVAWGPGDECGRPPLLVLQTLGANGWEVVGSQASYMEWLGGDNYAVHYTYLLKRPLPGFGAE